MMLGLSAKIDDADAKIDVVTRVGDDNTADEGDETAFTNDIEGDDVVMDKGA